MENFQFKIKHIPLKRAFDVCFSLGALAVFLPLMILLTFVVKCTSKGKVIYGHQRIGRGGKRFKCYKFRTMYADAEQKLKDLLAQNPNLREEWDRTHKLKNDPRVTPIGSFLRKTSLDELPQFWNVLKGDLSVVGPRPVAEVEVAKFFGAKAAKILSIRPGVTGPWQVQGRSDIDYKQRIKMAEEYVDTHSMILDLKLIVKTIPAMISSKGAY